MSLLRKNIAYTGVMTLAITLFMVVWLMAQGVPAGLTLFLAVFLATMTAVMSAILLTYRGYLQRRAFDGKKSASDDLSAIQTRTVDIDLPYDAAFLLALDALQSLNGQALPLPDNRLAQLENLLPKKQVLTIREADRAAGKIEARLRVKTLGITDWIDFSRLSIQLEAIDGGSTRLTLDGRPNLIGEVYDLGKNAHYVNELALYLRRESQSDQAAARLSIEDEGGAHLTDDTHHRKNAERGG